MRKHLFLALIITAALLGGCADEKVYDWQRPHDTYLVATFSRNQAAEDLKSKLQKNGFESRIETELKNGQFNLNVLADVYEKSPDTLSRLESISGVKPVLRGSGSGKTPKSAIPAKDI
jgi:hypothetical protein